VDYNCKVDSSCKTKEFKRDSVGPSPQVTQSEVERKEPVKNLKSNPKVIDMKPKSNIQDWPTDPLNDMNKKPLKGNIASYKSKQDPILNDPRVNLTSYKNIDVKNISNGEYVKTLTSKLNLNSKDITPKKTPHEGIKEPRLFASEEIKPGERN
jgi:hypothetical protein